jgi:hypothetical protein
MGLQWGGKRGRRRGGIGCFPSQNNSTFYGQPRNQNSKGEIEPFPFDDREIPRIREKIRLSRLPPGETLGRDGGGMWAEMLQSLCERG